jgi:DNA (cytosine-5)-methyltransferase 1
MKYLSVCSGIEAASVAWHGLDLHPLAFSEIEPFPSALLKFHYPKVPNVGDMTKFDEWFAQGVDLADADLLVGGTPCQAFSWAGLRQSLKDARGNLSLTYIKLLDYIDEKRNDAGRPPAVCLWENVPGVLNTPDNAFGCFLGGLAGSGGPLESPNAGGGWQDAGYVAGPLRTIAWRCLDAQYFGLAQRRHRVFVVASARKGFDPGAILFESEGVRRDSPPSREEGERVTGTISSRTEGGGGLGTDFDLAGGLVPETVGTLTDGAHMGGGLNGQDAYTGRIIPAFNRGLPARAGRKGGGQQHQKRTPDSMQDTAHTLKGEGHDASEDGTGRGVPIIPVTGGGRDGL